MKNGSPTSELLVKLLEKLDRLIQTIHNHTYSIHAQYGANAQFHQHNFNCVKAL